MSDMMTQAVIMMPLELAMSSDLSRRQFHSRAQDVLRERDTYRELCGELLKVLVDAQNTLAHCKAGVGYVHRQTDTAIKLNTAIIKAESILGEKK